MCERENTRCAVSAYNSRTCLSLCLAVPSRKGLFEDLWCGKGIAHTRHQASEKDSDMHDSRRLSSKDAHPSCCTYQLLRAARKIPLQAANLQTTP